MMNTKAGAHTHVSRLIDGGIGRTRQLDLESTTPRCLCTKVLGSTLARICKSATWHFDAAPQPPPSTCTS
eukprot:1578427-Pyramimonas_sp.AAC.1